MFPCPKCETHRGDADALCPGCKWKPQPRSEKFPARLMQHLKMESRAGQNFVILGVTIMFANLVWLISCVISFLNTPSYERFMGIVLLTVLATSIQVLSSLTFVIGGFGVIHGTYKQGAVRIFGFGILAVAFVFGMFALVLAKV